ncbi:MAG: hypothetical protein JO187_01355 [Acidobacteria bacterium]|nr:hypothetical protein [Acidobacteriota bacterium]
MPAKRKAPHPERRTKKSVVKLRPEVPAARDEGPRLVPWDKPKDEMPIPGRRFLELADLALSDKKPKI